MMYKVGQIMLYVNNQEEAVNFWTEKAGFVLISEEDNEHGMKWFTIAPTKDAETSIVLHNKEIISKLQPELNLATPSLLFFSENLEELRSSFVNKNITVGEIVHMGSRKVFNFADSEGNYFAVEEK
ncbi:VOC family protein [Tumebacillus sp. ITR2]|uniref:VOC family protein n=1 Tax=Tumebacillus amylolyticus TaxID=2801339 RepID=A0ABS1JDP8_9BACL|nr:VOC family protein [Tumebacillus amylolyticus]MBL0388419.1 VOC family protein [Tumebacillus amylolyticus]